MPAPVEIETSERGAVRVRVRGTLDAEVAAELHERLRGVLGRDSEGEPPGLIIDLSELRDYDVAGYERLVAAQRELAAKERRSAYIITRPRVRGMIFKVIHITQDERTRPVVNLAMAEDWLAQRETSTYAEASLRRAKRLLERVRNRAASRGHDERGKRA